MNNDKRDLVVVDLETTGLNVTYHWPLEVAAVNVTTGEELYFVPFISDSALGNADGKAMQINRYYERGVWEHMLPDVDANKQNYDTLRNMLRGNTLGGSNPRFDAAILQRFIGEPWHQRLADIAAYAAPSMHLPPNDLPGLDKVCAHLDVTNEGDHTALGDARATARCFALLAEEYTAKTSVAKAS